MEAPLIFDIQRYAIHDGAGIRTTVFFKGCPLACAWCHNPESQAYAPELMVDGEKCTGCGACAASCPQGAAVRGPGGEVLTDRARCVACGACAAACPQAARSVAGRRYSPEELARLLLKDRLFYEQSGGGVTLSGGEAAAQDIEYLEALARILKREGISMNLDTCGLAPTEHLMRLCSYTDTFLYDLKALDGALHRHLTGQDNRLILHNLEELTRRGARIQLRVPVIGGANDGEEQMRALARFIAGHTSPVRIDLLPYHDWGLDKLRRLGRGEGPRFETPDAQRLHALAALFEAEGARPVHIGG